MTVALWGKGVADEISKRIPGSVASSDDNNVVVSGDMLFAVAEFLKTSEFAMDYLANLTSVDYLDYFEIVYHLVSLKRNHRITLKTRVYDREKPAVASVVPLWRGADLQEREVYDLMGIAFEGHPNLKRIFLWNGYPGHPLRRDYL
ncbi:MAG TPA: NADH-quinone oxidoreductase subunit C [Dehalococcoidia bacterium]|nr:NADH-quinone oxidoreductase subunit C [Dehalococcoidia bacterium]